MGTLILIQALAGVQVSQFLMPVAFIPGAFANISTSAAQVIIAALFAFAGGLATIGTAVILMPIVKYRCKFTAYGYLGFSIFSFTAIYYFQTIGALFQTAHGTHLVVLLVSCCPLSFFYYLLYQSQLIHRFLSVWGFVGIGFTIAAILLVGYNYAMVTALSVPLGLNQLFLALWLAIKGFNLPEAPVRPDQVSPQESGISEVSSAGC